MAYTGVYCVRMVLSGDVVVQAGAELAAKAGLGKVGVRAVAGGLGVTPMALYRHIGDGSSLQAAVVEHLLADLPEIPRRGAWDQRCREWAHSAREVLSRAPGLASHVLLNWIRLPRVLIVLDGLVTTLQDDGPAGVDAVAAANALLMQVLMRAQAEEAVRDSGLRRDLSTLRSLRARVPALWERRDEYRLARLDAHFDYGLDALLAGLASSQRTT
jgi:AcrR family transcriptional regulator